MKYFGLAAIKPRLPHWHTAISKLELGKQTSSPKSRGVKQGCSLSPAPFNIYIDQLAKSLEEIPGLTLSDTEVKCLLFADDLILLAPSKEALQKQLDHLQKLHAPSSSQGSSVLQLNYYTWTKLPPVGIPGVYCWSLSALWWSEHKTTTYW